MSSDTTASNPFRLLVALQQVNQIAQSFSGCLDPIKIAKQTTDQLVTAFGCAFARIWLVESDCETLCLVASSGLYTHTNGAFAKVPMGAFKVGKIAQNRIPFLSNHLAEEPWVKDREWAIAQKITGFAGYPLLVGDRVVGVLAVFSRQALSPEFLEVLQWLCTTVTIALDGALSHQRTQQSLPAVNIVSPLPLSEQIAALLPQTRFVLVGTERALQTSPQYLLLRTAEILSSALCSHCRLTYDMAQVKLDAMLTPQLSIETPLQEWILTTFNELRFAVSCFGGEIQTLISSEQKMLQVILTLPYQAAVAASLSNREQQIFRLLTQGLRDREIADRLHISERTVKFHVNNAIAKLKSQTRYQALYQAMLRGWLE